MSESDKALERGYFISNDGKTALVDNLSYIGKTIRYNQNELGIRIRDTECRKYENGWFKVGIEIIDCVNDALAKRKEQQIKKLEETARDE